MSDYAGSGASQEQPSQGLALARAKAGPHRVHTGNSSPAVGPGAVVWQRLCLRVVELPSWLYQLHCCHEHGSFFAAKFALQATHGTLICTDTCHLVCAATPALQATLAILSCRDV